MVIFLDSPSRYLYFYLPLVKEMRVIFPFYPQRQKLRDFLTLRLLSWKPTIRALLVHFEFVYRGLKIPPLYGCSFHSMPLDLPQKRVATLRSLLGKILFKPYSNHHKNQKDKFIQRKGQQGSQVVVEVDGTPLFPLAQTNKLVANAECDYKYITSGEAQMICLLEKLNIMESCVVID